MVINDLMVIGQDIFNYTKNERVFTQKTYFCMILKNKVMKGVKGSETKRLIREAAYKQFLTKDYNTVPLKEIEKSLNLSRGCMSYHYPSKQELFIDVIDFYIFHKQDAKNKFKDISHTSLLVFIDHYIYYFLPIFVFK